MKQIVIIDYGMGNLWSVQSAINYLGSKAVISSDKSVIEESQCLVLPGVGSYRLAMEKLNQTGLDKAIFKSLSDEETSILGICLGMQLLGKSSDEDGYTEGLNIVPTSFHHFDNKSKDTSMKIPHVGFNSIEFKEDSGIFKGLENHSEFYFVHSYRALSKEIESKPEFNYATCNYGVDFLAAFSWGNIHGTQFHPEKSQTNGLILLNNFINK